MVADKARHQYRGYSEQEVNNAVVAHYLLYLGGLELFESLYQAQGKNLVKMVAAIQQSIEGGEPPFEAVRQLVPDQSPLPKGETPRGVRLAPTF